MASAPLLLLIVAALPRVDAVVVCAPSLGSTPSGHALAHSDRAAPTLVVRSARPAIEDAGDGLDDDDDDGDDARSLLSDTPALVTPPDAKRPAREPLVEALEQPLPVHDLPPALAPRTEPGDARGPPAFRL